MSELHRRSLADVPELRTKGGKRRLAGYAAVFNQETRIGGLRERVAPGAFTRAVKNGQDVRALIDHDSRLILGRTSAGTLRLGEDQHGLHFEVDLPDTSIARDLAVSLERGDITGASFGFMPAKRGGMEVDNEDPELIWIRDVDLYDVGPVTFPAYEQTEVGLRMVRSALEAAEQDAARNRWAELKARFDALTAPDGA